MHRRGRARRQRRPVRLFRQDVRQRLGDVFALERQLPGQHLEDDDAERPEVGALVRRRPSACSGAMYAAVPRITPTPVICAGW